MSKYVLSMILFGGLIGGGLLGGGLIGGCGVDAAPGGGNGGVAEGEGQGEGEGAEGEGSPNGDEGEGHTGEGEGEGGVVPPGADGTPCTGMGQECQEGLECQKCDETGLDSYASGDPCDGKVCTCNNPFGGRWFAEFTNVRTVDYEYDTSAPIWSEFWASAEIQLKKRGCAIEGPRVNTAIRSRGTPGDGGVVQPPNTFVYKTATGTRDGDAWITFTGQSEQFNEIVRGTCEGTYPDTSTRPDTFFRVACDFKLTRR